MLVPRCPPLPALTPSCPHPALPDGGRGRPFLKPSGSPRHGQDMTARPRGSQGRSGPEEQLTPTEGPPGSEAGVTSQAPGASHGAEGHTATRAARHAAAARPDVCVWGGEAAGLFSWRPRGLALNPTCGGTHGSSRSTRNSEWLRRGRA